MACREASRKSEVILLGGGPCLPVTALGTKSRPNLMESPVRHSNTANPIQGFTPSEITTVAAAGVLDVSPGTGIVGIRISADSEYYINADSANKATMPAGVTIVASTVYQYTFTAETIVEIMK